MQEVTITLSLSVSPLCCRQLQCIVRQRIPALLYIPSGWEVQSAVWVQQEAAEEREVGQVGLRGCNPPASMNKTKSKVPSSYTIPVRKGSVHPGSPRAEWTFPGTNLWISPETEALKLHCVLWRAKNAWNATELLCCGCYNWYLLQICTHGSNIPINDSFLSFKKIVQKWNKSWNFKLCYPKTA